MANRLNHAKEKCKCYTLITGFRYVFVLRPINSLPQEMSLNWFLLLAILAESFNIIRISGFVECIRAKIENSLPFLSRFVLNDVWFWTYGQATHLGRSMHTAECSELLSPLQANLCSTRKTVSFLSHKLLFGSLVDMFNFLEFTQDCFATNTLRSLEANYLH